MSRKIKDIKDKNTGELVYPRTHVSAVVMSSNSTLEDLIEVKQDKIDDLDEIRSGAAKGDTALQEENLKTINGESIVGSGNITISGSSSDANVQAVDTGDVLDDVTVNYATKTYVDGLVGDINSVLESIINGGGSVSLITFTINDIEYQAEEGMTWEQWINSEYNTSAYFISGSIVTNSNGASVKLNGYNVISTDVVISGSYIASPGGGA